jgi:hypothetical protein
VLLLGALYAIQSLPRGASATCGRHVSRARAAGLDLRGSQVLFERYSPGQYSFYDDDRNSSVAGARLRRGRALTRSLS